MQPSSEAYEADDRCFRVSVARRLMLPHRAAANAADVVQFCPNKSVDGVICSRPVDPKQHHCYGGRYGGGVDRKHAAVGEMLLRMSINLIVASKVFIEQEVPALTRVVKGQTAHARMDLVFNLNGSVVFGCVHCCSFLLQSVPGLCSQHKTRTYGQEIGEEQIRQVSTHQLRSFHP